MTVQRILRNAWAQDLYLDTVFFLLDFGDVGLNLFLGMWCFVFCVLLFFVRRGCFFEIVVQHSSSKTCQIQDTVRLRNPTCKNRDGQRCFLFIGCLLVYVICNHMF